MKKNAVNTLVAAASLLPAINAQSQIPYQSTISYRFSQYQETEVSAEDSGSGEAVERYKIDVHQLSLEHLINDESSMNVSLQHETLSGASPWFNAPGGSGETLAFMSGASIEEERTDASFRYARHKDRFSAGVSVGVSTENDYEAFYFGGDLALNFNQKNTTVSLSFSTSDDTLEPTFSGNAGNSFLNNSNLVPVFNDDPEQNDPDYCDTNVEPKQPQFCRVGNDKNAFTYAIGISQILSPTTIVLWSYGRTDLDGFLSDPYKLGDYRPDTKQQVVTRLGLREYFPELAGGLHIDYRYYDDNWKVNSHTVKVSWAQNIQNFLLVPSIRYYSQDSAFFYRPDNSLDTNTFFSSDARLSDFTAMSFKLKAILSTTTFNYHASFEVYNSDSDSVKNPGLVDYDRFTLGIDYVF